MAAQSGDTNLKDDIRRAWDRGAGTYDRHYGHGLKSEAERDAWTMLLWGILPPEEPRQVLDIGTGTGFIALLMATMGHRVIGLDLSPGMIEVARTKAEGAGLSVDFRVGEAESLPFADGSYDVVICRHVLWTLTEPVRAVREWARVTRPGGRVIAIDGVWLNRRPISRLASWAGKLLQAVTPGRQPCEHSYSQEICAQLPMWDQTSTDQARQVLAEAGLQVTRVAELAWLDRIERRGMPLAERLTHQWRRYLIEGSVPLSP
jgi:ubiquinone/menaquinone biosynthesis C-methylase UbiE